MERELGGMWIFIKKGLKRCLSICQSPLHLDIRLTSITNNYSNNIPLRYWWQQSPHMLLPLTSCCSPCHQATPPIIHYVVPPNFLLSPLDINSKGIVYCDTREKTPIFWWRYSNASWGRGFVRISAICSVVLTYYILMFCSTICSQVKW